MKTDDQNWPAWYYGPNGESQIFQNEKDVPSGWKDHPSKHDRDVGANTGTRTAVQPANVTTTEEDAARTTDARSQTQISPEEAAQAGISADGSKVNGEEALNAGDPNTARTDHSDRSEKPVEIDTDGWPWSPDLHSTTKGKTKDGLWRMKVGVKRPASKPGFPLDL